MTGSIGHLILALAVFVGGHFILSHPLRRPLVALLSENGFRAFYSILAALALIWTIFAYRAAPYVEVWAAPDALRWPVNIVMWLACILLAGSFMTGNPYLKLMGGKPKEPVLASGVFAITRHPLMWSFGLWALSHFIINGDLATLWLTGGIALLALLGAYFQDQKLRARIGPLWEDFTKATSYWPFAAMMRGGQKLQAVGVLPVLAGSALYLVLLFAHYWMGGVPAAPAIF